MMVYLTPRPWWNVGAFIPSELIMQTGATPTKHKTRNNNRQKYNRPRPTLITSIDSFNWHFFPG